MEGKHMCARAAVYPFTFMHTMPEAKIPPKPDEDNGKKKVSENYTNIKRLEKFLPRIE